VPLLAMVWLQAWSFAVVRPRLAAYATPADEHDAMTIAAARRSGVRRKRRMVVYCVSEIA
jgi:hypothetical protein